MKNIILFVSFLMLSGCSLGAMVVNHDAEFDDPRWENRSKRIELAESLIGKSKNDVIAVFGKPNPRNINSNGGEAPLNKGDPYGEWIKSEEEWAYRYYEHGIPLINSVNYWISFHFIKEQVVAVDY